VLDIPAKIAQNAADVIASAFSLTTALPLLTGVLGPIINPINALGSTAQDVVDALGAGDVIGALTAVVNVPAVLTGALLNGFEAADGTLLPGLLSMDSFSGGLVQGLLLTIPRAIADALGANTSARAAADEVSTVSTDAPATVTLDVPESAPVGGGRAGASRCRSRDPGLRGEHRRRRGPGGAAAEHRRGHRNRGARGRFDRCGRGD
jgi:hypothetical protein